MKNLVLMVCAFALFSFSSCEKCLNCIKAANQCGYCEGGGENQIQNNVTYCSYQTNVYPYASAECKANGGIWKVSSFPKSEQEVCGNTFYEARTKTTPFESDGYICM